MAKITKTWKNAGRLPGQYQRLTITFLSRDGDDVKVKWDFYAKSLGYDTYNYSTRHNTFKIYCPKSTVKATKSYQAQGYCASVSYSGTFTVSNVGNKDDDLVFYYENNRIWATKTNAWDPRSTGVVDKTTVGTLSIPKNTQHSVDFDELVNDDIHNFKIYHGESIKIPTKNPTNSHFDFKGWTSDNYAKGYKSLGEKIPNNIIEKATAESTATINKIKVDKDLDYYAVWRPKTCQYKFYGYDRKLISDLTIKHKWNTETKLPNLDTINKGAYKKAGYTFHGWVREATQSDGSIKKVNYNLTDDKFSKCVVWPANGSEIKFYAKDSANDNNVIFHFPDKDITFNYSTDDTFDMSQALTHNSNILPYQVKPGYNLVGWSTSNPEKNGLGYAMPDQAFSTEKLKKKSTKNSVDYYIDSNGKFKVYPYKGKVIFDYSDFNKKTVSELHLYPYYEYYTTAYVYVKNGEGGEWKLAMPYIYTNKSGSEGTWKPALSFVYNKSDTWEL